MRAGIRHIIVVNAHRRGRHRCPRMIHSLGTAESLEIAPTANGFFDLAFDGDVTFRGLDPSYDRLSRRTTGGASVAIYHAHGVNYFRHAVAP